MEQEDKYDKLPLRQSRWEYITEKFKNMYNLKRFDHPWMWKDKYHKLALRLIEANIGKSFDKIFSKYCEKVTKEHQSIFLEYFDELNRYSTYYVDKNRCIQKVKNKFKR